MCTIFLSTWPNYKLEQIGISSARDLVAVRLCYGLDAEIICSPSIIAREAR